jgi:tripartite-type tricarboxylate transporter receptor subunit TctC
VAWHPRARGHPRAIVDRLNREIVAAVKSQENQDRLLSEAVIPIGSSPEGFATHISRELARAAKVVKESGAKFN